ncbi:uncharacterized protein LOC129746221 [Uranotaenia lowii]|uniref:uncharacterized protein LOC129746221 n=1 Tax=Uranotaenia lowii TaxID=190385 RepID=UPI002478C473|nr:uncharacterized protein LOC129746221 [Uranotaenia lowii]
MRIYVFNIKKRDTISWRFTASRKVEGKWVSSGFSKRIMSSTNYPNAPLGIRMASYRTGKDTFRIRTVSKLLLRRCEFARLLLDYQAVVALCCNYVMHCQGAKFFVPAKPSWNRRWQIPLDCNYRTSNKLGGNNISSDNKYIIHPAPSFQRRPRIGGYV